MTASQQQRLRAIGTQAGFFAFYLALSALLYHPALSHLDSQVIGSDRLDAVRNFWGFWWTGNSLFHDGGIPAHTDYLNYPAGQTVLIVDTLNCVLSLPLQAVLGMPAAYNVYLILATAFSAWAAFRLAACLSGSQPAGLVAGAVYGFAPYGLAAALHGTSELVNMGWIPLVLLFLHRALQEGRSRDGVLAGLFLACTTLSSWYYGFFTTGAGALYAAGTLAWMAARGRPLQAPLRALGLTVLIFLGFACAMLSVYGSVASNVGTAFQMHGGMRETVLANNGVNAWELYEPSESTWQLFRFYHLPWVVLLALPAAFLLEPRRSLPWVALGGCMLVLSFSYRPQTAPLDSLAPVLEQVSRLSVWTYAWFERAPFASMVRFPCRALVIVNLAAAVVVALGAARLLALLRVDARNATVIALLVTIELTRQSMAASRLPDVFTATVVAVPDYVRVLSSDPDRVAVIHLPAAPWDGGQMLYQTVHGKPLVSAVEMITWTASGGPSDRLPFLVSPLLNAMHHRAPGALPPYGSPPPALPDAAKAAAELARLRTAGVRYLVLHRSRYPLDDQAAFDTLLAPRLERLGAWGDVELYRLR